MLRRNPFGRGPQPPCGRNAAPLPSPLRYPFRFLIFDVLGNGPRAGQPYAPPSPLPSPLAQRRGVVGVEAEGTDFSPLIAKGRRRSRHINEYKVAHSHPVPPPLIPPPRRVVPLEKQAKRQTVAQQKLLEHPSVARARARPRAPAAPALNPKCAAKQTNRPTDQTTPVRARCCLRAWRPAAKGGR
ncbi:hypothetical protein L1887_52091 [Cichorium endivia]|nr:hypothetical protein L1887_52091 [Cichorium endivia]